MRATGLPRIGPPRSVRHVSTSRPMRYSSLQHGEDARMVVVFGGGLQMCRPASFVAGGPSSVRQTE